MQKNESLQTCGRMTRVRVVWSNMAA